MALSVRGACPLQRRPARHPPRPVSEGEADGEDDGGDEEAASSPQGPSPRNDGGAGESVSLGQGPSPHTLTPFRAHACHFMSRGIDANGRGSPGGQCGIIGPQSVPEKCVAVVSAWPPPCARSCHGVTPQPSNFGCPHLLPALPASGWSILSRPRNFTTILLSSSYFPAGISHRLILLLGVIANCVSPRLGLIILPLSSTACLLFGA